jgi:serpin B
MMHAPLRRFGKICSCLAITAVAACGGAEDAGQPPGTVVISDAERERNPDVSAEARTRLVEDGTAFALDVYHQLRQTEDNLFFSPFSVSLTLAMIYGGARGETEAQMADALSFGLPQESLHPAFNWLDTTLQSRDKGEDGFTLKTVNTTFGQEGQRFLDSYLDLLAQNYGAGMSLLDFRDQPEAARKAINGWVGEQTEGRIPDLLPENSVSPATVLVLVNAVYFKAAWASPFNATRTESGVFHAGSGDVSVPMMTGDPLRASYLEGEGFQAAALPYRGQTFDMVIVLPEEGKFDEIEGQLDGPLLNVILGSLRTSQISVTMPRFEIRTRATMNQILQELGMKDAFAGTADFSGIDGMRDLYLSIVQHEAFVRVDEAGTEAGAATAGGIDLVALPTRVVVDRPFLFLIRDVETNTILFLGRVMNPA